MSMMDSRLNPNTTLPLAQVPGSSGPRWRIRCDASATASAASRAAGPTNASSPHTAPQYAPPRQPSPSYLADAADCTARVARLGFDAWSTLRSIRLLRRVSRAVLAQLVTQEARP